MREALIRGNTSNREKMGHFGWKSLLKCVEYMVRLTFSIPRESQGSLRTKGGDPMRSHPIGKAIAISVILAGGVAGLSRADPPATESKTLSALKTLLEEGIARRGSLDQIAQTVRVARQSDPDDPVFDYAHGLVLLSRVQPAKAVLSFEAALERRPTYLPAWQALLRTRLIHKDMKSFQTEALKLAKLARDAAGVWRDESERVEAAKWLGRAAGFLSLPDGDLLKAEERERFESALKRELGSEFDAIFAGARDTLLEDYQKLQQKLKQEFDKESKDQTKKADTELAELEDRDEELDKKTETLKLTADQWKDWLDQRVKKADQELKTLETQYKTLEQAAQGVSQLIQQTQVDLGRMQTSLSLQGIRGTRMEAQPAVLQLQQELGKYQTQYLTLEQRGANVLSQAQQVLAARAGAVRRYQQATGKIVEQTDAFNRWKKTIEKASQKVVNQNPALLNQSLKKRLSLPASYFELDEKAELVRLIQQAGGTPETP